MSRAQQFMVPTKGGGISYLIRDLFTDTRAAGAVNGMPATPGPGTRNVADTAETNVTVGSGYMSIAGTGTWGQSACYYSESIARVANRVIYVDVYPTGNGAASGQYVGLQDAAEHKANPLYVIYSVRFYQGGIDIYVAGALTDADVAVYAANTQYRLRFTLKATGCTIDISGGAFGALGEAWTTLKDSGDDSTATLYLAMNARLTDAFRYDNVQVFDSAT